MGALRDVLAVLVLLSCCNICIAAPKQVKPQDQVLFDSLNSAYRPLKDCVDKKLSASGMSRQSVYFEIAVSDGFAELLQDEKRFLGIPTADVLAAKRSERVRRVIEALEHKERWDDKSYMYKVFHLRRQIAATSIVARSPSIGCEQPRELGNWIQEADDFETYVNLMTYSVPFADCVDKHLSGTGGYSDSLAAAIVKAGKLSELRKISKDYLSPMNPYVLAANSGSATDETRVRALFAGLAQYEGSMSSVERNGLKLRRAMVMIALKKVIATSTHSTCALSPALSHWINEVETRRQQ